MIGIGVVRNSVIGGGVHAHNLRLPWKEEAAPENRRSLREASLNKHTKVGLSGDEGSGVAGCYFCGP
jgi:hypothetical protein